MYFSFRSLVWDETWLVRFHLKSVRVLYSENIEEAMRKILLPAAAESTFLRQNSKTNVCSALNRFISEEYLTITLQFNRLFFIANGFNNLFSFVNVEFYFTKFRRIKLCSHLMFENILSSDTWCHVVRSVLAFLDLLPPSLGCGAYS